MLKFFCVFTLLIGITGWPPGSAAAELNSLNRPATIAALNARLQNLMKEERVAGVSYAVFDAKGVVHSAALGLAHRDTQQPLTEQTRLRIGSVTKILTALLAMRAIEQGRFALDTPVLSLLSNLPIENPFEREAPVRIVHLLEHTAGFDDMQLRAIYRAQESDEPHWIAVHHDASALRVRWQPGTKMSYSNTGYSVLAALLETLYGRRWEQLVNDEVLQPLQMNQTSLSNAEAQKHPHASGYSGNVINSVGTPALWHRAAGAAWSTARDLAQLGRFLMTEGRSHPGVLRAETVRAMRQIHSTTAARAGLTWGYGLGLFQSEHEQLHEYGHNGAVDGFAANLFFTLARGMGYAEIHNNDQIMNLFARPLAGYIATIAAIESADINVERAVPATLAANVKGWYRFANTRNGLMRGADWLMGVYHADVQANELQLTPLLGVPLRFRYVDGDRWRDSERTNADTILLRNEAGQIVAIDNDGSFLERTSTVSAVLPPVLLLFSLIALLTAPFGRRRALNNPWLRRLNLAAMVALLCIVVGIATLNGMQTVATISFGPVLIFIGTTLLPLVALFGVTTTLFHWRQESAHLAKWRSLCGIMGALMISVYFACFDWLGLALWLR